jgi:hypothetical protein
MYDFNNMEVFFCLDTRMIMHRKQNERSVENVTIATQLKQTLASLKSAQASLEGFALQTDNQEAKHMYEQCAQQAQTLVDSLNTRVEEIQQEEPQYRS